MLYTSGKLRRNVFINYVTIALLDSTCLWYHSSLRINVYMHDIRVFTQVKGNGQFSHAFSQSVLFHKCFNGHKSIHTGERQWAVCMCLFHKVFFTLLQGICILVVTPSCSLMLATNLLLGPGTSCTSIRGICSGSAG